MQCITGFLALMQYINVRFTYLLTYLCTYLFIYFQNTWLKFSKSYFVCCLSVSGYLFVCHSVYLYLLACDAASYEQPLLSHIMSVCMWVSVSPSIGELSLAVPLLPPSHSIFWLVWLFICLSVSLSVLYNQDFSFQICAFYIVSFKTFLVLQFTCLCARLDW